MRNRYLMSTGALVAASGLVFAIGFGENATAARGMVTCVIKKQGKKRVVNCPRGQVRGARGKRGARGRPGAVGPAGPAGPAGAPAGAGSGLNLNFNAYLTANKTKELAIGNFTITAASNGAGACEPIRLRPATGSRVAVGAGSEFSSVSANASKSLTNGKNSNMFTAVSNNGSSTMSGIVGAVTVGNVCVVSGYVTGQ